MDLSHLSTGWLEGGTLLQKRALGPILVPLIASMTSFFYQNALSNFWQVEKMSFSSMTMTFVVVNLMLHALFQSNLGGKAFRPFSPTESVWNV